MCMEGKKGERDGVRSALPEVGLRGLDTGTFCAFNLLGSFRHFNGEDSRSPPYR